MADTEKDEYWGRNAYGGYGDARDPSKPSGMGAETQRYANMGRQAADRPAYEQNYAGYQSLMDQANNSGRGGQTDALGMIRQRAAGEGPSAAEIAGKNAQDQALASTVAAAGSARGGPMQQAAVMRGSLGGLATQSQGLTNQIQAGRANEIANAQDAYMQGTTALRSGDFQGAGLELGRDQQQIQNEQFQRGLNQQAQLTYEQQRQKVYEDQLAANQAAQQESDAAWGQKRQLKEHDEENAWGKIKDIGGAVAGGVTGAIGGVVAGSDERMKLGIQPIGSLSGLSQTGMTGESSPTGSMSVKGGGLDVMGSLAKTNAIDTQYEKNPGGGMVRSDERSKTGTKPMTDAAAQKEIAATQKKAGDEVAATRKAGGYAQLDMAPSPTSYGDKGYQGRDAEKATAKLHGAIEAETEGANPYAPAQAAAPAGDSNADEAARIRAEHPLIALQDDGTAAVQGRSMGEQAQLQHDQEAGKGPSAFSRAMLGMSQNFLGGSLGGVRPSYGLAAMPAGAGGVHPGRDVTYSDDRTKLAAAWSEGNQAAQEETRRLLGMSPDQLKKDPHGIARDILVAKGDTYDQGRDVYAPAEDVHTRTIARSKAHASQAQGLPPGVTMEGGITFAHPGEAERLPKADRTAPTPEPAPAPQHEDMAVVPRPSPLDAIKQRAKGLAHKAVGATTAALDKAESATSDAVGSLYPDDGDPMDAMRTVDGTTTSDKRAKEVLTEEEPMREANRAMTPSAYAYRPEYTPPGQKPGETNVGPIAQNMKRDPVASTAIVTLPDGMLAIDKEKGLKLAMGSLASLQKQIDALSAAKRKEA